MIRILIADDHMLIREGIRKVVEFDDSGIEVVGQAGTIEEAVHLYKCLVPDLVLMDIGMPGKGSISDGIEAARLMKNIRTSVKIIILSGYESAEYCRRAMEAGCDGYIVKGEHSRETIIAIIRNACLGLSTWDEKVQKGVLKQAFARDDVNIEKLTNTEKKYISALTSGKNYEEIATAFYVEKRTVSNAFYEIRRKLEYSNNYEVIAWAIKNGL
ncbi:MAG: DNA-binding response regulator [Paenibacillaceae bacterium]|nr:DNA-binding response regulator [Paenibacillaceae bacterium]